MLTPVHLFSVLALSFLGGTKAAIGPTANLRIVNQVISPDGFNRPAVLPEGTFPGPLIRGTKGNTFALNVVNALTDSRMERSTTIHWHGIHQKGHNFADGVAFVTQCPIITNHSFLYQFPVPDQAGTYWYHSHLSTQYCDGLRGAMIVYDPNDPHRALYNIDDESTVITLADWFHKLSTEPPAIHTANSTLINGKGRYTGGPMVPLSVIGVTRSSRYRFRLIAMTCAVSFTFSIDGHNLTVIEADGENTLPHPVDSLQIHSGQRYSVILHANQPIDNYWIRANPSEATIQGFSGGRNSAILRYANAPPSDPTTVQRPSVNPLREVNLRPLTNPAAPGRPFIGGADINLSLITGFGQNVNGDPKFMMNGSSWVSPIVPTLLQILSGAQTAQDLLPKGSYYDLPPNKVVELSLPGAGNHPFHLHGHSFSVVRSGDSNSYDFQNPVRRDTVNTGGTQGGNTTIRFVTDNAGPWILHCHIDWHFEFGLAFVFAEDLPNTAAKNPVPDAWKNLCPLYNSRPRAITT